MNVFILICGKIKHIKLIYFFDNSKKWILYQYQYKIVENTKFETSQWFRNGGIKLLVPFGMLTSFPNKSTYLF